MNGSSAARCVDERTPLAAELRCEGKCTTVFCTGRAAWCRAGSAGCAAGSGSFVGLFVGPGAGGVGRGDGDR